MTDMTLGQLVRSLSREVGGSIESADEGSNIYVITVPFTDGRSQQVTVFLGADADGDDWFVASSRFGAIADLDLTDLFQRNYTQYGFSYVGAAGDDAVVLAQLPLAAVSIDLGKALIVDVAAKADGLEEEFYGDDTE
ncbi:MAG: hypothetical protein WCJ30_06250 [Deltaproteobacteria bacterium]